MVYFSVLVFFIAVFALVYVILINALKDKIRIKNRIENVKEINNITINLEEDKTFSQRALMPIYESLCGILLKITPSHKLKKLNKRLEKAGMIKTITVGKWLIMKNSLAIIIAILFFFISYYLDKNILKAILIFLLFIVVVNAFFNFYLSKKIATKKIKILKELPYTLDLITVSVEAGLSFDGAMTRVVNSINGELCDEFGKALKEIKMGIERKTALKNMGDRCEVKELSMLVTSIIQADALGVSLGKVLRIEATNLRDQRKQIAREKAMKAPVKMLFPLIFFIFPSIFIIILGPAAIQISKVFFGG